MCKLDSQDGKMDPDAIPKNISCKVSRKMGPGLDHTKNKYTDRTGASIN